MARDTEGNAKESIDISDIQNSRDIRMQESTFDILWSFGKSSKFFGEGEHGTSQSGKKKKEAAGPAAERKNTVVRIMTLGTA